MSNNLPIRRDVPIAPFRLDPRARCRNYDPDLFYPLTYRARSEPVMAARRVCWACPLMTECGDWAVKVREPEGIWGSLTPYEREQIWYRRNAFRPHELAS